MCPYPPPTPQAQTHFFLWLNIFAYYILCYRFFILYFFQLEPHLIPLKKINYIFKKTKTKQNQTLELEEVK